MTAPTLSSYARLGLIAAILTACGGGGSDGGTTAPPPTPTVQSVAITPASVVLTSVGATRALTAEVRLSNGTSGTQAVTWTTGDASIASVSTSGTVTAVARGQTTITAAAGSVSGTATIVVATAQTISVTPATTTLASLGQTATLTADVRLSNGDASTQAVTWTSVTPAVATVNGNVVTAVSNGQATITAAIGSLTGSATIIVQQQVATVTLLPADTVVKGPFRIRASVRDARNNPVAGVVVQYTSLAPTINAIDTTGLLTPQGTGVARVRVTAGGMSATSIMRTVWNVQQLSDLFPLYELEATVGTRRAFSDVDQAHATTRAARMGEVAAYLTSILPTTGPADTRMYFTTWRPIWTEFIRFCGGLDLPNQTAWTQCPAPVSRHFFVSEGAVDTQLIGRFLTRQALLASNATGAAFPWFLEGVSGWIAASTFAGTQITGVVAPVAIADFKAGNTANNLASLDTLTRTTNANYYVNLAQRTPVAVRNAQAVLFVSYLAREFPAALAAVFADMRAKAPVGLDNDALIALLLTQTGRTVAQLDAGYLAYARTF